MTTRSLFRSRQGATLVVAILLVSIAVAAIALGGILLSSGAQLSTRFSAREGSLQASADGGLAIIRDSINRGTFDTLLPDSGYRTLANAATVTDAGGGTIAGLTRSLYVGRTGGRTGGAATAGQYGSNFASGVSIISDRRGAVAARRLLMTQESWAKFAVAINNWSGSAYYGCGEAVNGPFFSNTTLSIQSGCTSPKTLFAGTVSVVGSISNVSSGNFKQGYKTAVNPIPWPTPARIGLMQAYATSSDAAAASGGDYDLVSKTTGSTKPGLRIEFLTIDVNGDGIIEWDEGFMRVWVPANTSDSVLAYATGRRWPTVPAGASSSTDPNMISRNCGAVSTIGATQPSSFYNADSVYNATAGAAAAKRTAVQALLTDGTRRCYLGGDPRLFRPSTGDTLTPDSLKTNTPLASNNFGWWKKRRSGALASLASVRSGDKAYLIPLGANPNFKGVIFVTGDVALSGRLRGRVSVFATGNIVMADDLLYTNPPGTKCDAQGDIFGAIATKDVVIEDNNLQTPFYVNSKVYGGFDDTGDANYNMFFLAAGSTGADGNWYGEGVQSPWNYYTIFTGTEPATANASWDISAINQSCATAVNGCVRVTGGLAQGRVDNATYYGSGYYGWAEAHTYDPCGAVNPPPYFPTTGRFIPSRYYEIDPAWLHQLTVTQYFRSLQAQ